MYKGEADWELIGKIAQNPKIHIPIFGNGDIDSPQKAATYKERYGVQGIMIGRASIGNPWIFNEIKQYLQYGTMRDAPNIDERIATCTQHFTEGIKWKGEHKGLFEMRKHYGNYFKGISHFKPFRMKLVTANEVGEVFEILEDIRRHYAGVEIYA
jgi:tRNA-dihydrouridine synthase